MNKKKYTAFIIPTGIGASIGGYAGDAGYCVRKFAKEIPLIVNPNVVNAACFSAITDNMLYTEGYTLCEFFKGNLSLIPSQNNRIGIIFDRGISKNVLNIHINTINAVKTVYGINIIGYEISDEEANVNFYKTENGISSGSVYNPETLKRAGEKLLDKGAEVIAAVCKFDEPEQDDYSNGNDIDIVGGVEAVISHYLTRELNVPVVHAPAFEDYLVKPELVHPKAAAEYITPTFLPCLLLGLTNAPKFKKGFFEQYVTINDVNALIMPFNALGTSIVINAIKKGILVITVKENKSILNITDLTLGLKNDIINLSTYDDCLEFVKRL